MDRARIRWRNVARLAAGAVLAGLALALGPGLLTPSEPPPLPADVGLATGPERVYAATGAPPGAQRPHDARPRRGGRGHSGGGRGGRNRDRSGPAPFTHGADRRPDRRPAAETASPAQPPPSPAPSQRRPAGASAAGRVGACGQLTAPARRRRTARRRSAGCSAEPACAPAGSGSRRTALRAARNPLERRASSASSTDIGPALERRRLASLLATRPLRGGRARLLAAGVLAAVAVVLVVAERAEAGRYVVTQCSSVEPRCRGAWERSSRPLPRPRPLRHRRRAAGLPRCRAIGPRAVRRLGLARARRDRVHRRAGEREPHLPGGPPRRACRRPSRTARRSQFGAEHNDFRVHSLDGEFTQFHAWLRCAAPGSGRPCGRAGADAAHAYVRGVYLRTEDRATPSLPDHRRLAARPAGGPRAPRADLLGALTDGGGIRKVYVEAQRRDPRHRHPQLRVADGFATALSPCPATTTESAAVPTAGDALRHRPREHGHRLRRGPGPRRVPEPRLRAAHGLGRQRVPGLRGRRRHARSARASAPARGRAPWSAPTAARWSAARSPGVGGGATVCALTRGPCSAGADRRRRHRDHRRRRHLRDRASTGPEPRGVRPLRGRRPGDRPPRPAPALGRPSVARGQAEPRRPQPRPAALHRARCRGRRASTGVVKVQARLGKRRWQVFRTDRADADCAFDGRYKLRATRNARRYRFRALVPQQAAYPYERGHSATARVKVRRR